MRLSIVVLLSAAALAACGSQSSAPVQVQGVVAAMDGQTWLVGSNLIVVPTAAHMTGTPAVGADVTIDGLRASAGQVVASSVQVMSPPIATPAAAPRAAPALPPTTLAPSAVPIVPAVQRSRATGKGEHRGRKDD